MTEKNIFTDKLFLSLNIPDFNFFFYVKIATLLKVKVLSSPLFENFIGGSTLLQKGGGVHTMKPTYKSKWILTKVLPIYTLN